MLFHTYCILYRAMGTYNAAKHAVAGWVRTLDWMPKVNGIRVNAGMKYR